MRTNNCTVCGFPKEACLHQMQLKEFRSNNNVIRTLWFGLGFITSFIFYIYSCASDSFVTAYRIKTPERNYYVNHFKIVNDTIFCAELNRNGDILKVYALPYSTAQIEESK